MYGVTKEQIDDLRDFTSGIGLLKVASTGSASLNLQPLLPPAPEEEFFRTNDPTNKPCFRAGDGRVNENQGRKYNQIKTLYNKIVMLR